MTRYLIFYAFHKYNPVSFRHLVHLKRMNPDITIVPCFGTPLHLSLKILYDYLPRIISKNTLINSGFYKRRAIFELFNFLNKKSGPLYRSAQISSCKKMLNELNLNLFCDFTPSGWWNQDIAILNWYSTVGNALDFDYFIFFEYDMCATKPIDEIYGKYTQYDASFVQLHKVKPESYNYKYQMEESVLKWLKKHGMAPNLYRVRFCGCMLSKEVLTELTKYRLPMTFCERRLPSIVAGLGFSMGKLDFPMVAGIPLSETDLKKHSNLGIFHPVYW